MNQREIKSIVSLAKKHNRLYLATDLIGVCYAGVQVNAKAFPDLAKHATITVELRDPALGRSDEYPYRATAVIDGVRFYCIGTEAEFIEHDLFVIALQQVEL